MFLTLTTSAAKSTASYQHISTTLKFVDDVDSCCKANSVSNVNVVWSVYDVALYIDPTWVDIFILPSNASKAGGTTISMNNMKRTND